MGSALNLFGNTAAAKRQLERIAGVRPGTLDEPFKPVTGPCLCALTAAPDQWLGRIRPKHERRYAFPPGPPCQCSVAVARREALAHG